MNLDDIMENENSQYIKKEMLEKELKSDRIWVQVGTIFNIFMRPLLSGQIMVFPQYSCNTNGLSGIDGNSIIRNNMIVVYNRQTRCIQQNELNFNLKDIIIKVRKNLVKLMAPNMKRLILNMNNIVDNSADILCMTSYREMYTVYSNCIDCGEDAAIWISRYLNHPHLRLGYITHKENSKYMFWRNVEALKIYQVDERNVTFPDNIMPRLTLISYRSYLEVNKLLNNPVTLDQYNADICIIPNNTEPFEELKWEWIKIGDVILKNVTTCKGSQINVKNIPLEMKIKMLVLDCELYESGTFRSGDHIYTR
ncbi:mitochondrial amidoxime reducing component 2-like [Odontomachus brunneus]|uniref:mitochondrial amidoxime reducing component 2-like n=1 Tax=Odontomachus brunneus TaxID=486640 RepID=UPI0013F1F7C1|nr:mitochondrial amidoxime reducing component 2-like [Odontomachus brunneus]